MKFSLLLLVLATGMLAAEPRLALVAQPDVAEAAEALAAALENESQLTLVAGQSTDAEQFRKLAGFAADKRFGELAQALGVDGLITLSAENRDAQDVLVARLIAPAPGIALASFHHPLPLGDARTWSEAAVRQFLPLLGKLAATADHAVAVSVLRIRAVGDMPNARELESTLTLGLIHRLTHEPALIVLERERLDAFGSERERYSANAGRFWNTRWLVDGTISPSDIDPLRFILFFRLRSPGGPVAEFLHECSAETTAEALDAFAREMLAELGETPATAQWAPAREAARWLEEARWALGRELWAVAASAAESAWALGLREPELLAIRIRAANHAIATPYLLRPAQASHFVGRFLAARAARLADWQRTADELAHLTDAEKLQSVEAARRAQEILGRELDLLPVAARNALGVETAAYGSTVLEWFARAGDTERYRENLAALRQLLRQNATRILLTSPRPESVDDLFCLTPFLLPLWQENADDALASWQTRLAEPATPGQAAVVRVALVQSLREFPNFTADPRADRAHVRELWEKLTVELEKSARFEDRLAGFALHHDLAASGSRRPALAQEIRGTLWELRAAFASEPAIFRLFSLYRDSEGRAPECDAQSLGEPSAVSAASDDDRDFLRRFLVHLLNESNDVAWAAIDSLVRPEDYSPAQAAEVLAALTTHRDRLPTEAARVHLGHARQRLIP